jgi:hypothetical protein
LKRQAAFVLISQTIKQDFGKRADRGLQEEAKPHSLVRSFCGFGPVLKLGKSLTHASALTYNSFLYPSPVVYFAQARGTSGNKFMEKKVYTTRAAIIFVKRIISVAVVALFTIPFGGIGSRTLRAQLAFLSVTGVAILYLWYLKNNLKEVTLAIGDDGITYNGFILKGLFVRKCHFDGPWNMIKSVTPANRLKLFKQEIGPLRIETMQGDFLFWNSIDTGVNAEVREQLRKGMTH